MMSLDQDICDRCGSVKAEESEGLKYYSYFCPFCGDCYSRETIVDEDYYEAMTNREIPECKDSYETIRNGRTGRGVAYFASINGKRISSKYVSDDDFVYPHETSWDIYGEGVFVIKENEPDNWYEDMIKEIEENPDIDKQKSYVTKYDEEKKELVLLYGDKSLFLVGSNLELKKTLKPIYDMTYKLEQYAEYKEDKTIEIIKEKTDKIKEIVASQMAEKVLEIFNIIENAEDDEKKAEERDRRYAESLKRDGGIPF